MEAPCIFLLPFAVEERDALLDFMRAHNFATLVSVVEGELFATHLPLTVHADADDVPVLLRGHLAKANPQAHALESGQPLVIFQGPHAYISPTNYDAHESVPTWNYTAVHAYGPARVLPEAEAKLETLSHLIEAHEPAYQAQWDDLPARYRQGMLGGIVAFELTVTRLEGKYKLSQNRSHADQERVAATSAPQRRCGRGRYRQAHAAEP